MPRQSPALRAAIVALLATSALFGTAASAAPAEHDHARLAPRILFVNASTEQRSRVIETLERFTSSGLELPQMRVAFAVGGTDECNGHLGLFEMEGPRSTITVCTDIPAIVAHEFAHAWLAGLDDATRQAFMRHRGRAAWHDRETPWNQRGVEDAAVIIQQGVVGVPLPPVLGDEWTSRMQAFEILTGMPASVLEEWIAQRDVPCSERPSAASFGIPDANGLRCTDLVDILAPERPWSLTAR